jgi:RNA polymerase sigma-70 factor (ECF subfamily)
MRNHKTRVRLLAGQPQGEGVDGANAESAAIVRELLARVPDDLAEVAIHYYVDEMTHEEIARVRGCSRRHVGDLIERLHASLRDAEGVR